MALNNGEAASGYPTQPGESNEQRNYRRCVRGEAPR